MSCTKSWYEDHIEELSDEWFKENGYSDEQRDWLRHCFIDNYKKKG